MEQQLTGQIKFDPVPPLQFIYERISVDAQVQEEVNDGNKGYKMQKTTRRILKQCSGKFQPNTVTAILGPSGSGKTTMLNLLSGRLLSKNLTLRGRIIINGKLVESIADYKSVIGYVMQDDSMLPTFTPRETFRFITDMRLPQKTDQEKDVLVQSMIDSLGLRKCAETYIGNSLIRGLSGGERKRTSVGVQLLINPSLIFLDQPTTGLDSTTALNLIKFLNRLANTGRTVITTIHQPSSQIFRQFDMILLMLDGNVVYHNRAKDSMRYFSNLGLSVPVHSNPMDHYMKILNKEGIMLKYMEEQKEISEQKVDKLFQQRVEFLVKNYQQNQLAPVPSINQDLFSHNNLMASWCTQVFLIFKRSGINELRNPLGLRVKLFQMIFFAVVSIILYEKQATTLDSYIQNLRGVIFFLTMNICFTAIFSAINVFSQQKPVFVRQRLSNTYVTSSYYFGRSFAYIPIQMFLPVLLLGVCYFVIHLDNSGDSFLIMIGSSWLATWMASAYGLLLSTAFSDPEVALSLVPILIIPLMLVGGFFAPLTSVPEFYRIFEYISVFKYLYQTMIYSQFYKYPDGFQITLSSKTFKYNGNILGTNGILYFQEPFWLSMMLMGVIGIVIRILSFVAMYVISNPPVAKLQSPDEEKTFNGTGQKIYEINLGLPDESMLNIQQSTQIKVQGK